MNSEIERTFGNKVRIRACGLLIAKGAILLAEHHGLGPAGKLWIPPGGGVEFGERLTDALKREFKEETGIDVDPGRLAAIHEYVSPPLHAIEFFFHVTAKTAEMPVTGFDPELKKNQILVNVKFVTFNELAVMPTEIKHKILHGADSPDALLNLDGRFII